MRYTGRATGGAWPAVEPAISGLNGKLGEEETRKDTPELY